VALLARRGPGKAGQLEQAIAEYREAIRLKFDGAEVHHWLGAALAGQNKLEQAIAEYREATRRKPDLAESHYWLGRTLRDRGKHGEATESFRAATRLKPDDGELRYRLGVTLADQERWEEAIAEYREAIRLKPDLSYAYHWLGHALQAVGNHKEAIDAYRTAIRLDPEDAGAYCDLGSELAHLRDFSGSLAMYRKGHELGSRRPDWRQPSAAWVAEAERLAALEALWPDVRNGRPPRDNEERLFFADLAYHREHFATAARLWAEAFASDAKLMADRQAAHAYNAARAAVLAAAGKGLDDPPPDDVAKAKFRARALDLLKAELDARSRVLDKQPTKDRPLVSRTLELWRADPDLASVRDAGALTRLPEKDRQSWRAFWSDVDALLRKSKSNGPTR
jgi:Flp pilus assembly protein TadD